MNAIYEEVVPVPSRYKGVMFRSRTEARWAVFFDALGIEWQYEPEYFRLSDGEFYKPDFYLPRLGFITDGVQAGGVYVEVKPRNADPAMFDKAKQFAEDKRKTVLCLHGGPRASLFKIHVGGADDECPGFNEYLLAAFHPKFLPGGNNSDEYRLWADQEGCWSREEAKEYFGSLLSRALLVVSATEFDEYDGTPPGNECAVYRNAAVHNHHNRAG